MRPSPARSTRTHQEFPDCDRCLAADNRNPGPLSVEEQDIRATEETRGFLNMHCGVAPKRAVHLLISGISM